MDQPIPQWLTTDFLTECLQNEEGKPNLAVTNFSVTSAAPPGNNYGSAIIRVKVEYSVGEEISHVSLVIKAALTEGPLMDMFDIPELTESIFYKQFVPEANKLIETSFIPKSLYSPEFSIIVLEDLKEKGFVMADRTKQLGFDECRLYMLAAAALNAVSFAVHKKDPKFIESLGKERLFVSGSKNEETFKNFIHLGFQCLEERIKSLSKFSRYSELIRDISARLWGMLTEAYRPSKVMNTLNHGDNWITNMMFKYGQNGVVSEIKLLDFQIPRYGSAVNDVVSFLWSSANHEVKLNRLDELYQIYLETFNNKLKEFGCVESFTFDDFMENVQKLNCLPIFYVGAFFPLMLNPAPIDFSAFMETDRPENPYEKYYDENYCSNHFPKLLELLEKRGVFEYLEKYKH